MDHLTLGPRALNAAMFDQRLVLGIAKVQMSRSEVVVQCSWRFFLSAVAHTHTHTPTHTLPSTSVGGPYLSSLGVAAVHHMHALDPQASLHLPSHLGFTTCLDARAVWMILGKPNLGRCQLEKVPSRRKPYLRGCMRQV